MNPFYDELRRKLQEVLTLIAKMEQKEEAPLPPNFVTWNPATGQFNSPFRPEASRRPLDTKPPDPPPSEA